MILITSRPIQHAKDLQDIRIAIIAVEFISRSVKAEDEFSVFGGFMSTTRGNCSSIVGVHVGGVVVSEGCWSTLFRGGVADGEEVVLRNIVVV